jgi:microsomal dipeptidase-like Zn-dependent dipeptidase
VIADLHAHYAMHLVPDASGTVDVAATVRGRREFRDRIRALVVGVLSRFANYRSFDSGPRVTLSSLREGGVGVLLSVLYSPFDEMDLQKRYSAPPDSAYFAALIRQLEDVEAEVAREFTGMARIAHTPAEIDATLEAGEVALVHCVEGGFHLGPTPEEVDRNVTELARRGVAYITLGHLFYRQVATNPNAIPFLPDWLYNRLFPQPGIGLTELGAAAAGAMARERVLIDLSHMSQSAIDDTFALLDQLDPGGDVPVIASHTAYRFGRQDYNLSQEIVERIAARHGVIGLIFAEHQAADGLRRTRTETLDDSLAILYRHVNRIAEITGSHYHTAIGTDLDGFIKPTLAGLHHAGSLALFQHALRQRFDAEDAELITSANALRLLRSYWRGAPDPNTQ